MPTPATAKLPRPKSEDEFEDMALDALRIRWRDSNAKRYGRRGQAQHGVDMLGTTPEGHVGGQARNRDTATITEIRAEAERAEYLRPPLVQFFFVIAGPRDARLQDEVRVLSDDRRKANKFVVEIVFWDDICHELAGHLDLVRKYWPWTTDRDSTEARETRDATSASSGIFGGVPVAALDDSDSSTPELHVLKKLRGGPEECAATRYFKLWIRAPMPNDLLAEKPGRIRVASIEPDDEDDFLVRVRSHFPEDCGAALEPPNEERALVQNRPDDLRFHRRWAWWKDGALGLAATLEDVARPGVYSVADIAVDMMRVFALTVDAAPKGVGDRPMGPVRVTMAYDPATLQVAFEPGDRRARELLKAAIQGVRSVGRPACRETVEIRVTEDCMMDRLGSAPHDVAAAMLVPVLRKVHQARIETRAFAASLLVLLQIARDAARL